MTEEAPTHEANGGWMETFTGVAISYYLPQVDRINIIDIAHALSNLCRYNGHVSRFYSVAEHSVLAAMYAEHYLNADAETCMAVLFHDAAEAYIGDMPSPLKHLMPEFSRIEEIILAAVYNRFGILVTPDMEKTIKEIDLRLLVTERGQLLPATGMHDWKLPNGVKPLENTICKGCTPKAAEDSFMALFERYKYMIDHGQSLC